MQTIIWQLLLVLIVGALNHNVEANDHAENLAIAKKFTEECIEEGDLDDKDTERIMSNELFSPHHEEASEKLQCFLLCFYKKMGVIDDEGNEQPEAVLEYLNKRFSHKKDKIQAALGKCSDIESDSICEVVYKTEECIVKNIME